MKIILKILKFIGLFVLIFGVFFVIINFPAVKSYFQYQWNNIFHQNQILQQSQLPETKDQFIQEKISKYGFANNHIIIPKLKLDVPVVWDCPPDKFIANLKYGVCHYQGTAKPGKNSGNIFIAGHSSSYWWQRGDYSSIFSTVSQLKSGDQVIITYNKLVFRYKVTEKLVVKPTQVEVLSPTKKPIVTLMTCTPLGTAINRLIVRADQIYPPVK